ncbi:MAG: prolyl oligopeptidase family serine peptidase [Hyphomonadaceae bacterium]|nr:prolyl oligopeptidase family serine peptidase [Hyphomonadaceae bacterium]
MHTETPAAHELSTRELVELRLISVLAVAPNQQFVVIRVEHQDTASTTTGLTWRVIDLRNGETTGLVDGGDPLWNNNGGIAGEAPQWSPDSNWIYFRKLSGREMQIWRAQRDGTQVSQVTRDEADIVGFEIEGDGALIYAAAGATRREIKQAETAEYEHGVLMDPTVIKGFPISSSFPVNGRMATYRHLENAMSGRRGTLLGGQPLRVMLQIGGKAPTRLGGEDARAFLVASQLSPGFSAASGIAAVKPPTLDSGDLVASIEEVPALDGGGGQWPRSGKRPSWRSREEGATPPTSCEDPVCLQADLIQIVGWRANYRELVLQTETLGVSRLAIWNIPTDVVRIVAEEQGVLGSAESGTVGACQLASDQAICIAAAASLPPRVVSIGLETGRVDSVFDPNPNVPVSSLGVSSKIALTDRYGNTTVGNVILPRGPGATPLRPLVITSYTCRGFLQGGSGRDVPEHVLASLGYAAVCVDLGGSVVRRAPGFDMTPVTADLSALDFFQNAVDALSDARLVDPDRVALSGFSGSTTHTAYALTVSRKFTAAMVTTGGSFDAVACYLTANYRSCEARARQQGLSRPYDARDGILRDSPAWNAEKIRTPLLMQLPEAEYPGMMQLYGALQEYDRAVEMYVFADAYHYKNNPRQRLAVYDRNVEWINFWLKGIEPTGVDREAQAARWREMRDRQCALPQDERAHDRLEWYCIASQLH